MDKTSFYLLLSSIVTAAVSACNDEGCPHTVVLARSEREAEATRVCKLMRPLPSAMSGYGVVGKDCADLCDDRKMNVCHVPGDYNSQYIQLNSFGAEPRNCPPSDPILTISCTRQEERGKWDESCPIAGRRPTGLQAARGRERDRVADYLARAAHLEAASVFAFDKLAEDLARLGAPAALIDECLRAARDETEHARIVGGLARARDATPAGVDVMSRGRASALDIALENVVEGVVREAYGALQANLSGRKAWDLDVRTAMASIAQDEATHAWLALRIADWVDTRLSETERSQVARAKRAAIQALRSELEHEPARALRDEVGLPSRSEALALFAQLERSVWATTAWVG